ncbi:MAG: hypothetical protein IPM26_13740 [Saprospiraceae bacterium]|nr:hypothetical protein [Saprospiraceae bacterium]
MNINGEINIIYNKYNNDIGYNYKIFNIFGQLIENKNIAKAQNEKNIKINIHSITIPGSYFIYFYENENLAGVSKIIVF